MWFISANGTNRMPAARQRCAKAWPAWLCASMQPSTKQRPISWTPLGRARAFNYLHFIIYHCSVFIESFSCAHRCDDVATLWRPFCFICWNAHISVDVWCRFCRYDFHTFLDGKHGRPLVIIFLIEMVNKMKWKCARLHRWRQRGDCWHVDH